MRLVRTTVAIATAFVLVAGGRLGAADAPAGRGEVAFQEGLQPDSAVSLVKGSVSPAGKRGFLTVRDGRFCFPDGQRQKFWGVNVQWDVLPGKEEAPRLAQRLAQFGVNLARFGGPNARKLKDDGANTAERFDGFVAELKKNGIYVCLVLQPDDGANVYVDDPAAARHQKLADDTLLRTNRLTGLRYADEPAVAFVQIVNEETVFDSPRVKAEPRNLAGLERAYYEKMYKHLRQIGVKCPIVCASVGANTMGNMAHVWAAGAGDAISVNAPCHASDCKTHAGSMARTPGGPVSLAAACSLAGKPLIVAETTRCCPASWSFESPLLTVGYAALQDWDALIWGGPHGIDPACEMQFPAAARIFLQGMISPGRISAEVILSQADLFDPSRWPRQRAKEDVAHSPPEWLPFLSRMRNRLPDAGPSAGSKEHVVQVFAGPGVKKVSTSWGKTTISVGEHPAAEHEGRAAADPESAKKDKLWVYKQYLKATWLHSAPKWGRKMAEQPYFVSDTDQLRWRYDAGRFAFDAPACQGIVGEWGGGPQALSSVSLTCATPSCAVAVVSLDGAPLKDSRHMLLCAAAPSEPRAGAPTPARPDLLFEPVKAEVEIKHRVLRSILGVRWKVWALDATGKRVKEVPTSGLLNSASFKIGDAAPVMWYEVTVEENTLAPFR